MAGGAQPAGDRALDQTSQAAVGGRLTGEEQHAVTGSAHLRDASSTPVTGTVYPPRAQESASQSCRLIDVTAPSPGSSATATWAA